jgi:hypothetical protein
MKESDYQGLGEVWGRYASEKIITGTSPLLYRIMPDGKFDSYGKDHELWSHQYLSPPGVKLIPHVFCDSTCCDTCRLPVALSNAMARREEFFAESVAAAQKFGWDGYAMDFEGGMPDRAEASKFFQEWKVWLSKYQGRSGQPLEMHMWSPSGLDEPAISPDMNAMITMGSYFHGSYSSLLELDTNASSWRQTRASIMFEADSIKSVCPAGLPSVKTVPHRNSLSNAQEVSRQDLVKGLENSIDSWCQRVKGDRGDCGIGLITYDLTNVKLQSTDMEKLASGGHEKGLRSIWIWSGGVIPSRWEQGLQLFAAGPNPMPAAYKTLSTLEESRRGLSAIQSGDHCGCPFDGNYCCDGRGRRD